MSISIDFNSLKEQIKNIPPADLEAQGVITSARTKANGELTYICPLCGNGAGDSGDGIAFQFKGGAWLAKCFKCGEGFDNFKLLALHYNLDPRADFKEICKRAADDFNISNLAQVPAPNINNSVAQDKELELVKADIAAAAKNIENLPLDARRALSLDTLKKFNCGYLPKWQSPKSRVADTFATPTPRLIVPSGNHYLARLIVPLESFPADAQKYIHPKQHAGKKVLFGAATISDKTEMIYVFEGEIDAMSAFQAYETDFNIGEICAFVATCGAAETKWLDEVDKICKGFKIKPRFKIYFDNDDAGKDNAAKHRVELLKRGYLAVSKTLADYDADKFDANFLLTDYGEEFLAARLFDTYDDAELFAAAQIDLDNWEKEIAAEKAAADKAAKEKDLLEKIFTLPFSDMHNATRLQLLFGDVIRFSKDARQWMFFKNGVWECGDDSIDILYPFARKASDFIDQHRPKRQNKISADAEAVSFGEILARKWQERKTQRAAIDLLRGVDDILITQADLNKYPMLLNVKNGVVDLETGKLYPAAPELLLTLQCNAAYNPAARSAEFENFMRQILPDEMTRRAVLRFLGYCLTGRVNEEKALFVLGGGGNGKGTLFRTVMQMLGSYAVAFNVNAILKAKLPKDGEAATPEFAKLEFIRLAVANELPPDKFLDVAKFKDVTGSDPFAVRQLHKKSTVINPNFKMVFVGNYLPKLENPNDYAVERRLIVTPFEQKFTEETADLNLKKRLESPDNLSGILALLVRECLAWNKDGLIISNIMRREKQEYFDANNWIAEFIADNCEVGEEYSVSRKTFIGALKKAYSQAYKFTDRQLVSMIRDTDGVIDYRRTHGVYKFFGVKMRGDDEQGDFNFAPENDD